MEGENPTILTPCYNWNWIFDWSGVVSNDFACTFEAMNIVMQIVEGKQISFEEFSREFSLPYMSFWRKYTNAPKKVLEELFYKAIFEVSKPVIIPSAAWVIKELASTKHKMIVFSSLNQHKLEHEAEDYGIKQFFTGVEGSIHNKVKEIGRVMEKYEYDPSRTIYVGDMVHDIEAGKAAGVITIGVVSDYEKRTDLENAKPDYLVNELEKIIFIVGELNNGA